MESSKLKRLAALMGAGALSLTLVACGGSDDNKTGGSSSSAPASAPAAKALKVSLDTTFGTNGVQTVALSATTHDRYMAVAVAPDGKVYAAGFILDNGDQMMAVTKFDDKGVIDKTFGTGGTATANATPGGKTAELARAIAIQSDGKIIVGGPTEASATATGDAARDTDIAVARFDTAGKLDPTFGTGGIAKVDLGTGRITTGTTFVGDTSWGLGTLPGNKVVIMASKLADGPDRVDTDYVIVGLTAAGQLDTTFGTGGKAVFDVSKVSDNPRNLVVQSDGKIVATGYSTISDVVQPVIIRVSADGKPDATFGTNGVATAKVLAGVTESYAVALQGDSYISAGYGRGAEATEKVDLVSERFKANGTIDATYGKEGLLRIDLTKEDDRARNVIVLPDGSIFIAGSGKKSAINVDAMVVHASKDGVPDASFGENGVLITDLGGPADSWYGLALSADKKSIYVAGYKGVEGSGNDDAVIAKFKLE